MADQIETTYEIIISSFKALFLTTPLKEISVNDICNAAHVSRKTFYVYFSNKFDLIDKIFQDDILHSTDALRKLLPATTQKRSIITLERFYQGFYDNKEFYGCLICGKGQYWLRERMIAHVMALNMKVNQQYTNVMSPLEIEYMSYFFAASQAMLLIKWLREGCQISPLHMAEYYDKWAACYWRTLEKN